MRRQEKTRWLALVILLLAALMLASCGGGEVATPAPATEEAAPTTEEAAPATEEAAPSEEAAAPTSDRYGDPEQLSDTLNFYNWADYIDENILTMFEEECGVRVVMDLYTSNQEAVAKITAGNSGYDVLIPSDYAVKILSDQGAIQPLDYDLIPNSVNVDPATMGMYYDPDNTYSLPYQWSTTGIAYNVAYFPEPPTSYNVLFDLDILCENKGFVSMLDDERETIGMALQYLGYSVNDTDPAAQQEALELLRAQKDCIAGYNSENFIQTLASEEVVMAGSWGFAAALAYLENENIRYFLPEEGGMIWQDNMVIPTDAPHSYTAHVFINYLLEPDIGALLTEWTFGFTPNLKAEPLLSEDYYSIMETVGLLVDDETRARLEWEWRAEGADIFADTWTAVKSQ